jgi:hypothetical protein
LKTSEFFGARNTKVGETRGDDVAAEMVENSIAPLDALYITENDGPKRLHPRLIYETFVVRSPSRGSRAIASGRGRVFDSVR